MSKTQVSQPLLQPLVINGVPEVASSKNKPKFLEADHFCRNLY